MFKQSTLLGSADSGTHTPNEILSIQWGIYRYRCRECTMVYCLKPAKLRSPNWFPGTPVAPQKVSPRAPPSRRNKTEEGRQDSRQLSVPRECRQRRAEKREEGSRIKDTRVSFFLFPRHEKAVASRKGMRIARWIHSYFFVVPQRDKRKAAGAATVCL